MNKIDSAKAKDSHENDRRLIDERIEKLVAQNRLHDRKQALVFLFLCRKFLAEDDAIHDSITDGGNDLGIDAVYIDHRGEDPRIHLIQSKYYTSDRKSRAPFKYAELCKISRFFDVLKNRDVSLEQVGNHKIVEKIREIRALQDGDGFPDFRIWLLSNGKPPIDHEIEPVAKRIETSDIKIKHFHLKEIADLCLERKNVHDVRYFYGREDGVTKFDKFGISGAMGLISANELYDLIKDRADHQRVEPTLFDVNVRGFLGFKNYINNEIYKTAASSKNKQFWALNNGITMIATEGRISNTSDRPKIKVKNLSIVNGVQTCSAVFEAMKEHCPNFEPFRELSIAFRLFISDDPDLVDQISITTNSQNRINFRDLKANDEIQKAIEKDLRAIGIGYIRKRGAILHDEALIPLDAMKAGQIILAYQLRQPDRAKRESDHIFTKDYHRIFGKFDAPTMLRALTLFNLIWKYREQIEEDIRIKGSLRVENDFVTYGTFHILTLCAIYEEMGFEGTDDELIEKSTDAIAKTLRARNFPAYYSFFRDPKITADILKIPDQPDLFD